MKPPTGERFDAALDLFHDHHWTANKPQLGEDQLAELLVVLEPWFREEFTPKRSRVPTRKPTKVDQLSQARARRLVRQRSGGLCEVCGVSRATNYQHRKGKAHCSAYELWAPSNGLDVCGQGNVSGCHGLIHQNPEGAKRNGWTVPSWGDPAATPVYVRSVRVYLDDEGGTERYVPVEGEDEVGGGVSAVEGETQT